MPSLQLRERGREGGRKGGREGGGKEGGREGGRGRDSINQHKYGYML